MGGGLKGGPCGGGVGGAKNFFSHPKVCPEWIFLEKIFSMVLCIRFDLNGCKRIYFTKYS